VAKSLVVGVDGSEQSAKAAAYAVGLAGKLGLGVLLVHVVPSVAVPAGAIGFGEEWLQAHRVRGEALLDLLVNQLERPEVPVSKRLVDAGSPAEVLSDLAGDLGAEMVVVGSTGLNTVTRLLLGSVADRLTHLSPVPVLVVR
jgi:nucleotide-binding universal stress UspA family protein